MATFQILYWQDLPSQIKVWDDFDETRIELGSEFMARIDAAAQAKGLISTDDYLAQWKWSDEEEREGASETVAQAIKSELETKFGK